MKAYITKGCLSYGIRNIDVKETTHADMIKADYCYYHKGEWHRTEKEAVDMANSMVAKKILSLEKSLAKFQKMKFEVKNLTVEMGVKS